MAKNLFPLAGTGPNRKNVCIGTQTLYNIFLSSRHGTPSYINHDYHRLLGWMIPSCIIVNGGTSILYGCLFKPTNKEEQKDLERIASNYMQNVYAVSKHAEDNFLSSLKCCEKVKEIRNIDTSLIAIGSNIVYEEFPELAKKVDKDGLIDTSILKYLGEGVFEYEGKLLYPDKRFRRSCSWANNLNLEFLEYFMNIESPNNKRKIALDSDIIGDRSTLRLSLEMDYWHGPKFNDDIMLIQAGVTKYVLREDSPIRYMHGIDSMEFRWSENGEKKKVFECEELPSWGAPGLGQEEYAAKYMHGIFPTSEECEHVDGAIREYDMLSFIERSENSLEKYGKNTSYKKLWRMDGRIPTRVFKDLCHYYFRSDPLVEEYFQDGGDNFIKDREKDKCMLLPPVVGQFDDLIITVGFVPHLSAIGKRVIVPQIERNGRYFVDFATIALIKLFKRINLEFYVEKLEFVDWCDMVSNLPPILHAGDDSFADAHDTLKIMTQYLSLLSPESLTSFTLMCRLQELGEGEIFFSFCGNAGNILEFVSETGGIPQNFGSVGEWLEKAEAFGSKRNEKFHRTRDTLDFLDNQGITRIFRVCAPCVGLEKEGGVIKAKLTEPAAAPISIANVVKAARCGNCDGDYLKCTCVAAEINMLVYVNDLELFEIFYTDRSAWSVNNN